MSPSHVFMPSTASSNGMILVTARDAVLSTLRQGQRLSVQVLERIDADNVLLSIKGTPVTAQNLGDVRIGQKLDVFVESAGETIIFRRSDDIPRLTKALAALTRFGLGSELIDGKAPWRLASLKLPEGLPKILTRPVALLQTLLREVPDGEALRRWFALYGMEPENLATRLASENGKDSPFAALRRMLEMPASKLAAMIKDELDTESLREFMRVASGAKRTIEIFRAANLLADKKQMPLCLAIPYGPPEQERLAQVFWMGKQPESGGAKKSDHLVYIRMDMQTLGQVRAMIGLGGGALSVRIFAEEKGKPAIESGMELLQTRLRRFGLALHTSVMPLPHETDPDLDIRSHFTELVGRPRGLSVRA